MHYGANNHVVALLQVSFEIRSREFGAASVAVDCVAVDTGPFAASLSIFVRKNCGQDDLRNSRTAFHRAAFGLGSQTLPSPMEHPRDDAVIAL